MNPTRKNVKRLDCASRFLLDAGPLFGLRSSGDILAAGKLEICDYLPITFGL
jgi:hypothetical protein